MALLEGWPLIRGTLVYGLCPLIVWPLVRVAKYSRTTVFVKFKSPMTIFKKTHMRHDYVHPIHIQTSILTSSSRGNSYQGSEEFMASHNVMPKEKTSQGGPNTSLSVSSDVG